MKNEKLGNITFVTGTGTGVGKSVATGILAGSLFRAGMDVITVKMVQTGNDGYSEDLQLHRRIMGADPFPEDIKGLTAPQIFKYPSSALLAAQLEGRRVDLAKIRRSIYACAKAHDYVMVESAGGLFVPLTRDVLTIDFLKKEGWPTILVTNGALGSINHTLMSIEALVSRKIPLAGVVYCWAPDVPPEIDKDTPETIKRYLKKWGLRHTKFHVIPRVKLPEQPSGR